MANWGAQMRQDCMDEIQKCLNCTKERCNNCLCSAKPATPAKMGRPRKAVIRERGKSKDIYDSVSEAARTMGCSDYLIRMAIKTGKLFCGFWWRYA